MIDGLAQRYGVRPSELATGSMSWLKFDMEVGVAGSENEARGRDAARNGRLSSNAMSRDAMRSELDAWSKAEEAARNG